MNKLSKHSGIISKTQFYKLLRYIFDDFETVEENYYEHDEVLIKAISDVSEEIAKEALEHAGIVSIQPHELVGVWMMDGSRSDSNGFYWDLVDEIVKVVEVTETIRVTKWKPIGNEQVPSRN